MGKNQNQSRNGNQITEVDKARARMRDLLLKTTFATLVRSQLPPGAPTTAEKILMSAFSVISKPDPRTGERKLLECTDESIKRAILSAASLGFEFGGPRPTCWMIPRGGEAIYQTAAYGYITLAFRCGMKRISADVIYEADKFRIVRGMNPSLDHEITESADKPGRNIPIGEFAKHGVPLDKGGSGRPLYAYVIAWDAEGEVHWGYVTEEECVSARNVSQARNSPAHVEWGDQMRIRTAISRARKLWPDAALIHKAIDIDENEGVLDEELEEALRNETAIETEGFDAQKHANSSIVAQAKKNQAERGGPKGLPPKSLSASERLGADQPEQTSTPAEAAGKQGPEETEDEGEPNPAG